MEKKSGEWVFSAKNYTKKVTYKDGAVEKGNFEYRYVDISDRKVVFQDDILSYSFNSQNLTGRFIYQEKGVYSDVRIDGSFDENGFPDGVWNERGAYHGEGEILEDEEFDGSFEKFEKNLAFKNGILISSRIKDIKTGEIKSFDSKLNPVNFPLFQTV